MNPGIGLEYGYVTQHSVAFTSFVDNRTCNRVCNTAPLADFDVLQILSFFGTTLFTWAVEIDDTSSSAMLKKHGMCYKASFPAMVCAFDALSQCVIPILKLHVLICSLVMSMYGQQLRDAFLR